MRTLLFLPRNAKSCVPMSSPFPPKHELNRVAAVTPQAPAWLNRRPSRATPQPSFNFCGGAPPHWGPQGQGSQLQKSNGNSEDPAVLAYVLWGIQPNGKTHVLFLDQKLTAPWIGTSHVRHETPYRDPTDASQTPHKRVTNASHTCQGNPHIKFIFSIWVRIHQL